MPPNPTPTTDPSGDAIDALVKGVFASVGGGTSTPYKGLDVTALAKKFKARELTEQEFRAELEARAANGDIGPKAIDAFITDNQPESIASKLGTAAKETYDKTKSLSKLTEADILDGIKTGKMTAQEAYQRLITDKEYSPAAAQATVESYVAKQKETEQPPEYKQIADDLKTRGLGKNITAPNILAGVSKRLWSPDDAYKALIVYGGMDPAEAQAQLRLYFGIQGPVTPGVQLGQGPGTVTPPRVGEVGLASAGGVGGGQAGSYDQSSVSTLYDAGRKAGFSGDALDRIVATALAESGGNLKAHNTTGEDSRGPLQINVGPGAHPQLAGLDLYDPYVAMQQAFDISSKGTDFSPWTVWHQDRGAPAASIYQQLIGQQQPTAGVQIDSAPKPKPQPVAAGVNLGGELDPARLSSIYDNV